MTKRMTTQEIFKQSSFVKASGESWETIYAMVSALLTDTQEWRALRQNNTIFVYHIDDKQEASVTLVNAEKPDMLKKNMLGAAQAFQKAGFKLINFETEGRQFALEIRKMGFEVDETPLAQTNNGSTHYKVQVHV